MDIIQFPWTDRWLTGSEYQHMIQHYKDYSEVFCLEVASLHPCSIYSSPSHGLVYYLRQQTLRDLGFPRVKGLRKSFKWKKMNFLTPLPKQQPLVHYLVATGRLGTICYRMHVVACTPELPLLCHMLKLQDDLALGVGILPRQHFRDTAGPLPRLMSVPEPRTSPAVPMKRERAWLRGQDLGWHSQGGIHPVHALALRYLLGPFECEEDNSLRDNDEVKQEFHCKYEDMY